MKALLTLAVFITIFLFAQASAQGPVGEQQRAIVSTWQALGESYSRENKHIDELTKSFRMNPPWRVVDAREPAKRAGLIEDIIAEHERRISLFRKLKAEDAK